VTNNGTLMIYFRNTKSERNLFNKFLSLNTNSFLVVILARLKCKNCGAVFEYDYKPLSSFVHLGPYKRVKCPACGKSSFFNVYSSVQDSVTYPSQEKASEDLSEESDEEREKRQLEESKYERS
jgi:ribosomal protein S27AE